MPIYMDGYTVVGIKGEETAAGLSEARAGDLVVGTSEAAESGPAKWIEVESTTWGASADGGEAFGAGAGELPGSTQGRGLFVLSTAPLSGHTGGANMLLADGQVTFDPAEFFAADGSAAADHSGAFTVGFGDGSLPHDGPISFDAYDNGFLGGVRVPTSAGQGSGYAGEIEISSFSWGAHTPPPAEGEPSGPMQESMETMKKAGKDASFDPAEFFTADDSAAADQFGAIMIGFGDGSVRHVGPSATSGHSGSANLVSFDTATPTLPTGVDYVMDFYSAGEPLGSVPPTTHAVTERTSGLIYSGESGGTNESQTGHDTQMAWTDPSDHAAAQPQGYVWGLDRIDQNAGAYWKTMRAVDDDDGILSNTGGIFLAAADVDGNATPAAAGDNMQTYLELELTGYASGKASEDDFAAAPADTGNPLGNTYTGTTVIHGAVLQQDMTLSFSYDLV